MMTAVRPEQFRLHLMHVFGVLITWHVLCVHSYLSPSASRTSSAQSNLLFSDPNSLSLWPKLEANSIFPPSDYYEYELNNWFPSIHKHKKPHQHTPGPVPTPAPRPEEFNYNEQYKWGGECNRGKHQSPINIVPGKTAPNKQAKIGLSSGFNNVIYNATIKNTGHSVELEIPDNQKAILTGPALAYDFYQARQLHFHWGENDAGSEHSINNQKYPLEMHVVFYNSKYGSFAKASKQKDGLVVLAILFKMSSASIPILKEMETMMDQVSCKSQSTRFAVPFVLMDFLPNRVDRLYMYSGSLTTPPCSETVTWYIVDSLLPISESTLNSFRSLYTDERCHVRMLRNWRQLQPINYRMVARSPK